MTTWSKLDMTFNGVSVDTLLAVAEPAAERHPRAAFSHTGYTTNLPLDDVTGGKAWVAWEVDGGPLPSSTVARPGCSCRTSTSGRAPSGSPGCACSTTTSRGSGSATATTTAAIPWLEQRYQGD